MTKLNVNSYEYSNFSQNGEDGIIEFFTKNLKKNNKFFVEIGSGNGLINNSTNLVLNNWSGIVLDFTKNMTEYNNLLKIIGSEKILTIGTYLNLSNINEVIEYFIDKEISLFSLDIDSFDFYIMNEILKKGILPKILCLEYNSFLGQEPITVEYHEVFNHKVLDKKRGLYFGDSLNAWKELLTKYNYEFICVDKNGVNSFFVLKDSLNIDTKILYGEQFKYTNSWMNKFDLPGNVLEADLMKQFKGKFINVKTLI